MAATSTRSTNTFDELLRRIVGDIGKLKMLPDGDIPWAIEFETMALQKIHEIQSQGTENPMAPPGGGMGGDPMADPMGGMMPPGSAGMPPDVMAGALPPPMPPMPPAGGPGAGYAPPLQPGVGTPPPTNCAG